MATDIINYRGELAALTAALLWAIAALIYRGLGQRVSSLQLNLWKGVMAIGLIFLTLQLRQDAWTPLNSKTILLLSCSGILGIGLGDTFYFEALNRLGPRRTLILEALAPPLSAVLALIFLQETLGWSNWLGLGLTIAGVTWVVSERTSSSSAPLHQPLRGIGFGLLAALGQATGAVLSRSALTQSTIDPLESTLIRLAAAVFILVLLIVGQQRLYPHQPGGKPPSPRTDHSPHLLTLVGTIALTALLSTYFGIWLQQTALKYTATGIAQTLSATSPLFILPLAAWSGEKVSVRAILGVLVAIAGIALLLQPSARQNLGLG